LVRVEWSDEHLRRNEQRKLQWFAVEQRRRKLLELRRLRGVISHLFGTHWIVLGLRRKLRLRRQLRVYEQFQLLRHRSRRELWLRKLQRQFRCGRSRMQRLYV
jgi:hypothetical protein